MLYEEYKKPRKMFEMFRLIKTKQAVTPEELARILKTSIKTIYNYATDLNNEWGTDIDFNKFENQYEVIHDGILGSLKINYPITADDVMLIFKKTFLDNYINTIQNYTNGVNITIENKNRVLNITNNFS